MALVVPMQWSQILVEAFVTLDVLQKEGTNGTPLHALLRSFLHITKESNGSATVPEVSSE